MKHTNQHGGKRKGKSKFLTLNECVAGSSPSAHQSNQYVMTIDHDCC